MLNRTALHKQLTSSTDERKAHMDDYLTYLIPLGMLLLIIVVGFVRKYRNDDEDSVPREEDKDETKVKKKDLRATLQAWWNGNGERSLPKTVLLIITLYGFILGLGFWLWDDNIKGTGSYLLANWKLWFVTIPTLIVLITFAHLLIKNEKVRNGVVWVMVAVVAIPLLITLQGPKDKLVATWKARTATSAIASTSAPVITTVQTGKTGQTVVSSTAKPSEWSMPVKVRYARNFHMLAEHKVEILIVRYNGKQEVVTYDPEKSRPDDDTLFGTNVHSLSYRSPSAESFEVQTVMSNR